jgi:hypothetical protein
LTSLFVPRVPVRAGGEPGELRRRRRWAAGRQRPHDWSHLALTTDHGATKRTTVTKKANLATALSNAEETMGARA